MDWRGDVPLYACPFNEIDNIILAMSAFVDLEGIVPSEIDAEPVGFVGAMRAFERVAESRKYLGVLMPPEMLEVARGAVKSPRFREARLVGYVNEIDEAESMQFAALTFLLDDGTIYVAFRGTDDTLVGWREDLMMGFHAPIPAQTRAVSYLSSVAATYDGPILIGGHSKGGNIAMWAAAFADNDTKGRIRAVYNNDGPGFLPEIIGSEQFVSVSDRIITFIPQSSVVGVLLEQSPQYKIIKSTQVGILQHDPLSWEVKGTQFVYLDKRSKYGAQSDEMLKKWVYSMSEEDREQFANILFAAIDSTGAKTLTDLSDAKLKNLNVILKSLRSLDRETRAKMTRAMVNLLGSRPAPQKAEKAPKPEKTEKAPKPDKLPRTEKAEKSARQAKNKSLKQL